MKQRAGIRDSQGLEQHSPLNLVSLAYKHPCYYMLPRLANTDVPWKCNRQPSHISQLDLFTPTNFENASTAEGRTHHHIIQAKTTLRAEIDKRNRSFYQLSRSCCTL
jgi:hypothetical protein